MEDFTFKGIIAVLGTAVTFLFGGLDTPFIVLCVFVVLDYISGITVAIRQKNLSSSVGAKGIIKKGLIFFVLVVACMLDELTGGKDVFRTTVCFFYIANEGISILENVGNAGVSLPDFLKKFLYKLKEDNTESGGE